MALTKIKLDSMVTGTLPDANIPDDITITGLSGTNTGDQTLPTDFVSASSGGTFSGNVGIGIASSGATANTSINQLVIENDDSVGISILSPNTSSGYIAFGDPQDDIAGGIQYDHNADDFKILGKGDTSVMMTIDSSGNVGIGTTAPGTDYVGTYDYSPDGLLMVDGSGHQRISVRGATSAALDIVDSGAGSNLKWMQLIGEDNKLMFRGLADDGSVSVDDILVIDNASGNVGIGASPNVPFEVNTSHSGNYVCKIQNTHATDGHGVKIFAGDDADTNAFVIVNHNDSVNNFVVRGDGEVTVSRGNLVIGTAGKGIDFEDTGGTARVLDDYEEGTWTVDMTMSTSGTVTVNGSYDTAYYTKIGRVVHIQGQVRVGSVSSPVGDFRISLPFTTVSATEAGAYAIGAVKTYELDWSAGSSPYIETYNSVAFARINVSVDNDVNGSTVPAVNDWVAFGLTYIAA